VSPPVAPEKDSKQPEWEMECVTYPIEGNIVNCLHDNDLWKLTLVKESYFMSFYVRALNSKNGKLDARQSFGKGADFKLRNCITGNRL
jgi:hypothetical protein